MGFLDDIKSSMSDSEDAHTRYEELKHREASGNLDTQDLAELLQLRERFEQGDNP